MNLLIGKKNNLNHKLVEQIHSLTPVKMVELDEVVDDELSSEGYVFVNLLDVSIPSAEVLRIVKKQFPNDCIVAMHCFQVDHMINKLMEEGYHAYVSILDFTDSIHDVFDQI
ncbi:hypothetical protein [Flammeovirga aprica]|uniref:Uncharacterized protein n=1 Tax=Flammeovirga aprica JL-4 TaxID=694437 RepID=A0A7X9RZZ9_9BACT|nr:hypothetical protein [Flammeovirga aprica]NME71912.1 hypothetical protein [Flammeovirga aprica JL-4]